MSRITLLLAALTLAHAAHAGGPVQPVMEETVVAAETAASGGDNWVGVLLTVLSVAAVAGSR